MNKSLLSLFLIFFIVGKSFAQEPIIDEWTINSTGTIAKYYLTNGSLSSTGKKADITKLCFSDDSVWVKTTGMPSVFGPWTNPGSPTDQDFTFRFPRNPQEATVKTDVPTVFAVAVLINGAAVFGNGDARSYNPATNSNANNGQGKWNGNAFYTEGFTLDSTYSGHVNQDGTYHTHATPWKIYKDYPTTVHSPIVGFAFDGYPIYGPYGYSDPMNSSSSIKLMVSGYNLRTFVNNKRTTLPDGTSAIGPDVSGSFPSGMYIEDYEYVSAGADLDKYNGRYCVTPEYPNGTYAYFVTMEADGTPAFPYYIGEQYYGVVDQGNLEVNSTISMPVNPSGCIGDIPSVTLSVSPATVAENGGTSTITATLSASTTQNITVNLGFTGTATSSTDYTVASTIVVSAGTTSKSITLTSANDTKDEPNETVIIEVSSVTNGKESVAQQKTVTITDDDAAPTVTLSAGVSSIDETSGSTTITATLSAVSGQDVTVNLSASGTASASEYNLSGNSIIIAASNTSGSVTLTSIGDLTDESDETVIIDISTIINGTESTPQQQTVTITDDDASIPAVTLSAGASTITETSGSATIIATLSAAYTSDVTITLAVSGTASASDYSLSSTSITIAAGNTTGTVTLSSTGDLQDENNETVIIDIADVTNGTESGTQQQIVTINDDDASPSVVLSVGASSISEASGSTTVIATLSTASSFDVTLNLSVTGTASATEYSLSASSIIIAAGNTTGTVTLSSTGDLQDENNETVIIDISSVTNGTESGNQQQTVTISDDDASPVVTLTSNVASISEASGSTTITATLSAVSGLDVTITLTVAGSSSASDYSLSSTAITILAGNTEGTATVSAVEDAEDESNETVIVGIVSIDNGTESGSEEETITIIDNDSPTGTISKTIIKAELYPNPTTGIFNMEFTEQVKEVVIINNNGTTVFLLDSPDYSNTIDLTNFSDGLYFIKIISEKGFDIQKINIKK